MHRVRRTADLQKEVLWSARRPLPEGTGPSVRLGKLLARLRRGLEARGGSSAPEGRRDARAPRLPAREPEPGARGLFTHGDLSAVREFHRAREKGRFFQDYARRQPGRRAMRRARGWDLGPHRPRLDGHRAWYMDGTRGHMSTIAKRAIAQYRRQVADMEKQSS